MEKLQLKKIQNTKLNLNKNYFQIMTYEQFKQTKFYTGMFKYMLTQYSPEFTETVLKDLYRRADKNETLDSYK